MFIKRLIPIVFFFAFTGANLLHAEEYPCLQDVTISTSSGATSLMSCQGDIVNGLVKFKTSTQGMPFAYVVVDEDGTILLVSLNSTLNLSPFQNGAYRVYAFSFMGSLLAEVGDNIFTDDLASYCYELTVNYITLNSGAPEAGAIATDSPTLVCVGDGNPDLVNLTNTGGGDSYAYFVTDQDNTIVAISIDGVFDMDTYQEGTYFLWGFSHFGNLTAQVGMNITEDELADGCSSFSEGFIAITASNPDGGMVSLDDGSDSYDICDGTNADILTFNFTTSSQAGYTLVQVDENGIILAVLNNNTLPASEVPFGTTYVRGISFTGNGTITAGQDIYSSLSDDCYEISTNAVTLFKEVYQGGIVSLDNGDTEITLCVANGEPDLLNFVSTGVSGGSSFTFVITDDQHNILDFSTNGSYDFDTAPQGTCLIWALTYDGNLLVEIGDNLDGTELADACYGLSSNFITVNRQAVNGGTIAFEINGEDYYEYCSTDGNVEFYFTNTSAIGDNFRYVVTDAAGNITGIHPIGTSVSPTGVFSYTRYIYWLSFSGPDFTGDEIAALSGQNLETAVLRDGCYQLSSNRATLEVSYVDGGSIQLEGGQTSAVVCGSDINNGLLTFETTTNSIENQALLLTDANNNIITFLTGNTVNFNAAALGDYKVWNVSYTGDLTGEINDPAAEVALSDGCYDLSDNFVEILVAEVNGGTVSTLDGDTFLMLCPDGEVPESLNFTNQNAIGNGYAYILTDETGTIISQIDGNTFEFISLPIAGILQFWGVAYTGTLEVPFGESISTAVFSDECYELSENHVEIIYENAQAGTLTVNGGQTELSICVGDGNPDLIQFEVLDATHLNYVYVVTDVEDYIIGVLLQDSFDFDNAVGGPARIYGLSYSGNLNLFPGDNINDFPASDDCWDYTDEFVLLNKNAVDGGVVYTDFTEEVIYVCAGDDNPDVITFHNSSNADEAGYQYVLTTADNLILSFLTGNEQDFENTGFTTLRVWGVSYTGNFNMAFGSFIDQVELSDECYTLSDNFITIVRDLPEGGDVSTTDGETVLQVCIGAGSGIVEMATTSTSVSGYVYLLLDETGVILEVNQNGNIDFNPLAPGLYRIYGLSYTGELYAAPGMLATQVVLAGSCYYLSNNFVEVTRSEPVDGGTIAVIGSDETTFYTCPDDGISDLIILTTTSTIPGYRYIITDANNIVTIPQIIGPAIDFNSSDSGEFRIYGISFNGNSLVSFGMNILEDPISDNCYTTSANYITMIVGEPVGGTVTSDQGDEVTLVVGDGEPDVLTFSNSEASTTPYVYVITDEGNAILGFVDGDTHDFEGASPGICRIWGVAYTGGILAAVGDTLTQVSFSDDCYSLSDNYVTLNRTDNTEGATGAKSASNTQNAFINLTTYPNPATEVFTASFKMEDEVPGRAEILIVNLNGQIVHKMPVTTMPGQNEIQVNIGDLRPGLYMLHIRNDREHQSIRFSKQ
ncbi:MAG: T9SS type A sorting domain-containing protein [Saprospiraceae bacterium]|nr:T9SS type A sorting domain-containing protein [Saprospiraceae bacterium]MCB9325816.1 T9SS type A sorting domain-containing protein [Lewinellaceae bacterium]